MALIPLRETLKDMFKSLRKGFIYTPKFCRRASRAGLFHFPKVSLLSGYQIPQIFPARFARRIASFPEVFLLSGHQIPNFSRRASRAGLLDIPKGSLLSGHQIPQNSNSLCISYPYIIPSKGQKPAKGTNTAKANATAKGKVKAKAAGKAKARSRKQSQGL